MFDQSPLVQCSRCLRFGYGRRMCTEAVDLCSHYGGPNLRAECLVCLVNEKPSCKNCCVAKIEKTVHNAFDSECLVRLIIMLYAASVFAQASERWNIKRQMNSVQRGFAQKIIKSYRIVSLSIALILSGLLPRDM